MQFSERKAYKQLKLLKTVSPSKIDILQFHLVQLLLTHVMQIN